jgi:hypothetical protein
MDIGTITINEELDGQNKPSVEKYLGVGRGILRCSYRRGNGEEMLYALRYVGATRKEIKQISDEFPCVWAWL